MLKELRKYVSLLLLLVVLQSLIPYDTANAADITHDPCGILTQSSKPDLQRLIHVGVDVPAQPEYSVSIGNLQGLISTKISNTSIILSWFPVSGGTTGPGHENPVEQCGYYYHVLREGTYITYESRSSSYGIGGLIAETPYRFTVRALRNKDRSVVAIGTIDVKIPYVTESEFTNIWKNYFVKCTEQEEDRWGWNPIIFLYTQNKIWLNLQMVDGKRMVVIRYYLQMLQMHSNPC
ncbi:fibronectin type III domain-containing protein [Paenibacillus taiwanensis]|uniref:fibronectin type III domain-containing protein n=1 Tax=Paenibacillus taiwanensis TaxID=401638 RepID=UPI00048AB356|nr:fibronectin type III domain-containing protein [Paenibacillus taiwanensis]